MAEVLTMEQQRDLLADTLMLVTDGPASRRALSMKEARKAADWALAQLTDEPHAPQERHQGGTEGASE